MASKSIYTHYYVTISSLPREGTPEREVSFDLLDSNNYFIPIVASANIPVCIVQIPRDVLPTGYVLPSVRFPTYIISSNGSVTLELDPIDPYRPEGYFDLIAYAMLRCLNLPGTHTSTAVMSFANTIRGSDCVPTERDPEDGRTLLNIGKMFVDCFLFTALDVPRYTAVVHWPISLSNNGRRKEMKLLAVPTYKLNPAWSKWKLVSAELPKTRSILEGEPTAKNLCQFVHLGERRSHTMSSTQKPCFLN